MPYYTGTANSPSDLRQAIVNACTANGWTWDSTYNVLSKGAIYAELSVVANGLYVRAALGLSGGVLTNPAPKASGISDKLTGGSNVPVSWPATYHIFVHSNPDFVACIVNYQSVYFQNLMFGQGRNLGVSGSCVMSSGSITSDATPYGSYLGIMARPINDVEFYTNSTARLSSGAPFVTGDVNYGLLTSHIHLALDSTAWWSTRLTGGQVAGAAMLDQTALMLRRIPNAWNGDAILVPLVIHARRPSSLYSHVAELPHMRFTRNDYLADGDVITIGPDKWKVFPWYKKNTSVRDGENSPAAGHTGTFAIAIRYDGP